MLINGIINQPIYRKANIGNNLYGRIHDEKERHGSQLALRHCFLFCTAVLAEGANRNVPLDSALDAALNAPGSGIAFANGSAYPWQVVEIDGRTAAKSGNAGAANSSSAVSAQVTIAEGQSLSFDWNVDGEPTTGALCNVGLSCIHR